MIFSVESYKRCLLCPANPPIIGKWTSTDAILCKFYGFLQLILCNTVFVTKMQVHEQRDTDMHGISFFSFNFTYIRFGKYLWFKCKHEKQQETENVHSLSDNEYLPNSEFNFNLCKCSFLKQTNKQEKSFDLWYLVKRKQLRGNYTHWCWYKHDT